MTNIEPITATQQSLSRIFSDDYAFEIPPYQRPYSWEELQSKELFQDVLDACDEAKETGGTGTYFLGSVVLIKSPNERKSDVVDGQQRLTTLTILLAVLRDLSEPSTADRRHRFICAEGDIDLGTTGQFRVLPRPQDQAFFEKYIQRMGSTTCLTGKEEGQEAQLHFIKNAIAIKNAAEQLTHEHRDRLIRFLMQNCYLVVISVANVDTAHRVFRVLNTRGMDLAPTDILKAELLEKIQQAAQEQAAKDWEGLEIALGREKFVDLFAFIRMIFQKEKPRERLEIGFSRFVKQFDEYPSEFLNHTLPRYVNKYLDLMDAGRAKTAFGPQAARYLGFLRRLDNSDWIPPALQFLTQNNPKVTHLEFFKVLERCAYFLFVTRSNVNVRIARYGKAMMQLDQGKNLLEEDFSLQLSMDEKEDFIWYLDGPIYEKTRVRLPLLLRLDAALGDAAVDYNHEIITVEHIIPQKPKKDSNWEKIFTSEDDRLEWVHSLGNLLLLTHTKNVRASNLEFEVKKLEYFQSKEGSATFALTSTVLNESIFDRDTLERRHKKMMGAIYVCDPFEDVVGCHPARRNEWHTA